MSHPRGARPGGRRFPRPARVLVAGAAALLTVLGGTTAASGADPVRHANLLVPLYDTADPANWSRACSQANGAGDGSLVIADPANGPGPAPLPEWATVIGDCPAHGRASVIGYVHTDYGRAGTAGLAALKRQIDDWYAFYPGKISGIFLDEVSDAVPGSTASNVAFYRELHRYVHARSTVAGTVVVLNFGQNPGSDWMFSSSDAANADLVVTFEGSWDTPGLNPFTEWQPAAWQSRYRASDFAALIHGVPATGEPAQPAAACAALRRLRIGYVYVGTGYSELPSYYEQLASLC